MSDKEDGGGDFSHSMTDLMTSLAIVFLILAVAMIVSNNAKENINSKNFKEIENENRIILEKKDRLIQKIKKTLDIDMLQGENSTALSQCIVIDGNSDKYKIKIRLNGGVACKDVGLYFDEEKSVINSNNKVQKTVSLIGDLYAAFCDGVTKDTIDRVQILGHTDAVYSPSDAKNCESVLGSNEHSRKLQCGNIYLSSLRAEHVYLLLGKSLINKEYLSCFTEKTEISGRGPFDSETSKILSRDEKRRVEIVISLVQPRMK